ncbi:hypothetical protein UFOVP999_47 [uncultured Caudovirales phage]|uniref:Uncharacterized protein n=1 Tax=uncultured Caudovirales phage TaxID=2100421 RepID=A0A6J5QCM0_9CAUD|nr:hypothetical protein UFOVP999_47 [uncultured Caudovirales phage]
MTNYIEEYNDMIQNLAIEYSRKYQMLERDDIAQELWVWFVTHPKKYKEWSTYEQKDKDNLIAKSLRNAALKYCEIEKARKSGYKTNDLYYYDLSVVEAFLPSIITESYEIPAKIQDLNFKFGKGDVTDGNNWLALRSDIATGFYKLPESKQNILRLRFMDEQSEWSVIAKQLKTSPDGARMKVQRVLIALTKNLGGFRPFYDSDKVTDE